MAEHGGDRVDHVLAVPLSGDLDEDRGVSVDAAGQVRGFRGAANKALRGLGPPAAPGSRRCRSRNSFNVCTVAGSSASLKSTYRTPFPMNRGSVSTSSWSTEYTGRGPMGAGNSYVSNSPNGGTDSYLPSRQIRDGARVSSTNVSGLKSAMKG